MSKEHKYIKKVSKDGKWKYYYANSGSSGHRVAEDVETTDVRGWRKVAQLIQQEKAYRKKEKARKRVKRQNDKRDIKESLR